ncbi:MAG: hypothetical protein M3211_13080 [Actinomycetota bacterium]|nr:hypothetical protein [Actinomycetota bacterium]
MDVSRRSIVNTLASGGGAALGATFHLVGRIRPAAKPLHPRGRVLRATLVRRGLAVPTGVRWLDQPGVDELVVRVSRAMGLPDGLPDIHGLALRVPRVSGRDGDLLFATTGRGRITRYTLTPARAAQRRPLTTLLPYRTPTGPLLLAAFPRGGGRFDLACAAPRGDWRVFAELTLGDDLLPDADPTISFDPMLNTVPGLEPYEWVRRLREGAYAEARRTR